MEAQHKAMALSRLETQNKIYNILTPEQKKQFNANFEKPSDRTQRAGR
ncbi:Periplasmic protein [Klebsiella variicola]|uniref:Periplasmic protein n=1 Tax=Klebsiella variicola TaxID=244366 RepID=A0A7H4MI58_KLEVA|nr:Periplasmic protein [Klebsiella variicola]